jgi:nitrous oxide reductase
MTSYYDETGKWFSLKEIDVKKGDKVRIKVTNTKGMHNFVIDEYGISQETPLNKETVIEFTADKAGEFVYYCSHPGHREGGQWGTLKVTE